MLQEARRCVVLPVRVLTIDWPDLHARLCSQKVWTRAGLDMSVIFNIWQYILHIPYNDTTSRARALVEPIHQAVGLI